MSKLIMVTRMVGGGGGWDGKGGRETWQLGDRDERETCQYISFNIF